MTQQRKLELVLDGLQNIRPEVTARQPGEVWLEKIETACDALEELKQSLLDSLASARRPTADLQLALKDWIPF